MEKLILVITYKNKFGNTIIPYIAQVDDGPEIKLLEQATPKIFDNPGYNFSLHEKEVIEELYLINEKTIFKIFSKEKNLKLFIDNLKEKYALIHIRPYIEKHLANAVGLIAGSPLPIYYKDSKYSKLYENDKVIFHPQPADALFKFNLNNGTFTYDLNISSGNETIKLKNRKIIELSVDPAVLLIQDNMYWFKNIDSKKFRPFVKKDLITIPERSIDTYMNSFVKKCILNHKVEAAGFNIADANTTHSAILSLETDLAQQPVLVLKFKYGNKLFLSNTKSKIFVELNNDTGSYTFTRIKRNLEWEKEIIDFLIEKGLKESAPAQYNLSESSHLYSSEFPMYSLISWLNENSEELNKNDIKIVQDNSDKKYYTNFIELKVDFENKEDWFDINAIITIDNFKIPFYQFRKHIINHIREYILPDESIFIIPEEWFAKHYDLMFNANIENDKITLDKIFFNVIDLGPADNNSALPRQLISLSKNKIKPEPVPQEIDAELRPYQITGYSWLYNLHKNNFGGILADDMGLGKTLQALALLTRLYLDASNRKDSGNKTKTGQPVQLDLFGNNYSKFNKSDLPASLIIMPTSLIHNWQNEIKKFAPGLKVYNYTGVKRLKTKDIGKIFRHYHIVISTYGTIRNDIDYMRTYTFYYIILDESQYIKNPSSKSYKAVINLRSRHRFILTGTPIENSLTDLWAQMNFVNPNLLGTSNRFREYFIKNITKNKNKNIENKLKLLIDPFILRRTKEMVAKDLPPITEQVVYCDMIPEQKKVYEREKTGIRNKLLTHEHLSDNQAIMVLQALTRLRQIANHPVLTDEAYTGSSGKYEQVLSNLDDIVSEKHKVLVFSSFVKNLEIIEKDLIKKDIKYSKLTGSTTDRKKVIKEFTDNEECKIFLISLKAGGVGLNLVEADYVFMLNPWWNPAAESQAINRAHRIGQTKNVFVYRFISAETIEEKIANLQKKKQKLADTFITTENLLKNFTKEELEKLLT